MDKGEIEKIKAQNADLAEQVKLLVKTEIELHRAQAELLKSKDEIKQYSETLEQKVAEKTKELETKMEQVKRVNKLMVGRELKMKELKKEIAGLREKYEGRSLPEDEDEEKTSLS